jgi:hypothetical protein
MGDDGYLRVPELCVATGSGSLPKIDELIERCLLGESSWKFRAPLLLKTMTLTPRPDIRLSACSRYSACFALPMFGPVNLIPLARTSKRPEKAWRPLSILRGVVVFWFEKRSYLGGAQFKIIEASSLRRVNLLNRAAVSDLERRHCHGIRGCLRGDRDQKRRNQTIKQGSSEVYREGFAGADTDS